MPRFIGPAAAVVLLGCGLISSDVTRFDLRIPPRDFEVDTGDWALLGGSKVPRVECSLGCAESRDFFCGTGSCNTDCDEATQTCQVNVTIAVRNDYDLATEAPELKKIADQPVIS